MSQTDQILNHLQRGNWITPIEALHKFRCFRLAARINDLRNQGHSIKTVIIEQNNKKFAKYYLNQ